MPATEQTWRNQKLLHVVFAVSALLMTIATVWLLAKDHMRSWKSYQLKDRQKEAWALEAQRDQLAEQNERFLVSSAARLTQLDSQAFPAPLLAQFKGAVLAEDRRLQEAAGQEPQANESQFSQLDELSSRLVEQAAAAQDQRQAPAPPVGGESDRGEDSDAGDEAAATSEADATLAAAQKAASATRTKLLGRLDRFIREAKRRESQLVGEKKSVNGVRTAAVSELGIAIGEAKPEAQVKSIQRRINELTTRIAELTEAIAAAKGYRTNLESIVAQANAKQAQIAKEREAIQAKLARLDEQAYKDRTHVGEWVTRWPVLNALYNGNIRVEQNWLPDLTINYNFSQVARFDRCTTCHRAISKTAPETASEPQFPTVPRESRDFAATIATPAEPPAEGETLLKVYGLDLGPQGLLGDDAAAVRFAAPESAAARAGLQTGDEIVAIDGAPVYSPAEANDRLLKLATWDSTASLTVRRGLDHPYTAHPRLDLFLTDTSPHPQKDVGCTICHDGQGSGTSFEWVSHTPDTPAQQEEWIENYGWFDNHHWIFPMKPARFVESNCLKCHHEKGGLEPSERFPEPPAPKLVEGWTLVEKYGCFGCHEVNGYDGPAKTVGPDVRLEPPFHEVAAQLLQDRGMSDSLRELAEQLVDRPEATETRHELYQAVKSDAQSDAPELSARSHKLADALKDVETPGQYRKVGPSLRYLPSKVDFAWLYSWIRRPADFRPSTQMPQFFGNYEHLNEPDDADGLHESLKFEPVEIRAITEYLLTGQGEFEYLTPPEGVTEKASAQRGKQQFETRGCLACHQHEALPDGPPSDQGPNLTGLAAKFSTERGAQWLYSWIKNPRRYHARTKMPVLYLDPIEETDLQGKPTGKVFDPAADIVQFLLAGDSAWRPQNVPARDDWSEDDLAALGDLAVEWLKSDTIPESRARQYVDQGVPVEQAAKLKPDDQPLAGMTAENRTSRLVEMVARHTIGKYGCYGCHEIPGFEDAKPIGTGLVDWGRKESSKLAFENIHKFLESHGIDPPNPSGPVAEADGDADSEAAHAAGGEQVADHGAEHAGHLVPKDFGEDAGYYIQQINSHSRDGFLWQKLRYPRSYDYKTTRNKGWNERTRMPKFPFTDAQREQVMTFVLGLVKEPPADKFVYRPDARQRAIVDGRQVLERFNCAGCHILKMEQWTLHHAEDAFEPSEIVDYPFLAPQFTPQEIAQSLAKDRRGLLTSTLHGMPVLDEETGEIGWVDEDGQPITGEELVEAEAEEGAPIPVFYRFTPWRNLLLAGQSHYRGLEELLIPANRDGYGPEEGKAHPAWGGDLARYLFPRVIARAKESNPAVNGKEAWGWLPPPLMDEGKKVQPDWLHGFLMDPTAIRPAAVMRMPNFHMSSDEAAKLVDYFAAASDVEFPYEYKPQQSGSYLAATAGEAQTVFDDAMKIVTNGNYCVKCHAVADFMPQGDRNTFGPNLAQVSRRLRPEYLRDWIANPARILPYTGMPVNIPYRPEEEHLGGVSQQLFPGTSVEQLRGLTDLLLNFDRYAIGKTSVSSLVQAAPEATPAEPGDDDSASAN